MFKIEGYVETISSDGCFTIRGGDGFSLEKDGKKYNVFWNGDKPCEPIAESEGLKVPNDWRQWEYQMLVAAKLSHQKVEVQVSCENRTCVTKVTLK
ncbi:hypothetical protein [Hallerella succinigenes]|uniref:Uncharacterized protein n=1 Tax=Hallerella succinigenes TaxID=1896222 RepID=A0A2M9AAK6_9BACT|nr:hypothetical protein [Hallerella succinigenes]PJJ42734.1 hypothetical protein BGX16_2778 [Hallerella succinigenes]